jgi:hypothetical protein
MRQNNQTSCASAQRVARATIRAIFAEKASLIAAAERDDRLPRVRCDLLDMLMILHPPRDRDASDDLRRWFDEEFSRFQAGERARRDVGGLKRIVFWAMLGVLTVVVLFSLFGTVGLTAASPFMLG